MRGTSLYTYSPHVVAFSIDLKGYSSLGLMKPMDDFLARIVSIGGMSPRSAAQWSRILDPPNDAGGVLKDKCYSHG